jgi:putative thioredoxin
MDIDVLEVNEANFQQAVLDRSFEVPVVVDFWAEWCGPCRALTPVLEKLHDQAEGDWVLAKVDVDANPNLSAAAQIQSIPAVKAFKDGKIVSEFIGALPEPQVRDWLEQLGPSPASLAVQDAIQVEAEGRHDEALSLFEHALYLEPANAEAKAGVARLQLAQRATGANEDDLRERLDASPDDVEAAGGLADLAAARGDYETAFGFLLDIVRAGPGDAREAARTRLVELLDTLPSDDGRALKARRDLSLALY